MSVWEDLIDKCKRLEEIGSKIQRTDTNGIPMGSNLQMEEINQLVNEYYSWYGECLSVLQAEFKDKFRSAYDGGNSSPSVCIKRFLDAPLDTYQSPITNAGWRSERAYITKWRYPYQTCFHNPLRTQRQILIEASKHRPDTNTGMNSIENIERLARRFSLVARELGQQRYADRTPLTLDDEYDVQYLFRALLRIYFDDIRSEEPVPSVGGKSSRIDFLLKREQVVVEIKMTRDTLKSREVSNELILDMARYTGHPDFKTFIAIVYDPKKYIDNPAAKEDDLSKLNKEMVVKVIILQG